MALRRTTLIFAALAGAVALGSGRDVEGQETPFGGRTLPNVSPGTQPYPARTAPAQAPPAGYQGWYRGTVPQSPAGQQPPSYAPQGQPPVNYVGPPPNVAQAPPAEGGMLFAAPPAAGPTAETLPPGTTQFQQFPLAPVAPPAEQDRFIDIDAITNETQTGRFMVGVGVNSNAGLTGSVVIDEQNFDICKWPGNFQDIVEGSAWRGRGQRFRLEAMPGTLVQRYTASFQEPYLFDTPVSFGISGYFFNRLYSDWSEERIGGRPTLGYQFTPDLSGSLAVRAEQVTIYNPVQPTPPEIQQTLGPNSLYSFGGRLAHDTRDSAFMPTEGHLVEFNFEQVIGTYVFPKAVVDLRQYFLLRERPDGSGRHTLNLMGMFGVSGSDTPVFENFFAGGFNTIRGFRFRGASPTTNGAIVGGRLELIGSAEYIFPITADDMLRAVVFCDFGTVEKDLQIHGENFRVSPGAGLRISMPALGPAPIALDLAFPVSHAQGDQIQNFSFNVGLTR